LKRQIFEMEKEKMLDHAEILQLQKALAGIQATKQNTASTPVVPIKDKEPNQVENGKNFRATP
jgi:hypothetical protein